MIPTIRKMKIDRRILAIERHNDKLVSSLCGEGSGQGKFVDLSSASTLPALRSRVRWCLAWLLSYQSLVHNVVVEGTTCALSVSG